MTLTVGTAGTQVNRFVDNIAPIVIRDEKVQGDVVKLFEDYASNGPNPEYAAFQAKINYGATTYRRTNGASVWEFINDAVEGSGGFSNGAYLFPFKLELEDGTGKPRLKYVTRQEQADYDNFANHVCNTPWDVIENCSDLIERKTKKGTDAADLLGEFWRNCDGNGTAILDFLEYPHKQARRYGTGIIVMDRPRFDNKNEAANRSPENRPYVYAVPSQNVVHWEFAGDGSLAGIVLLEPHQIDEGDGNARRSVTDIRVWTKSQWALFRPTEDNRQDGTVARVAGSKQAYEVLDSGEHTIGEVPIVAIYNDAPKPKKLLAYSEMLDVARLAQTVYNIDSEMREVERKCAIVLGIPVKSTDAFEEKSVVISSDNAILYDGEAGKPEYISPDLQILEKLSDKRKQKKLDAYQMAGLGALAAITEAVKTASGYHAEVEFAKTERRISRHAAQLEATEKRLGRLLLLFYGINSDEQPDLFSVTYPRDFGVRDMDALIDRTGTMLDMNLGDEWDSKTLEKLAKAQFPRLAQEEIDGMVAAAVAARKAARDQEQQLQRAKALAQAISNPPLKPKPQAATDRKFAQDGAEQSAA